jgi:hypothetical protein
MDLPAYRPRSSACWHGRARARPSADLWLPPIWSRRNCVSTHEEKYASSPRMGTVCLLSEHTSPERTQTRNGSWLHGARSGTVLVSGLVPGWPATRVMPLLSASTAAGNALCALCHVRECWLEDAGTSLQGEDQSVRRQRNAAAKHRCIIARSRMPVQSVG